MTDLLSVAQAAKLIGITESALRLRISKGQIKYQIIDGHIRIHPDDAVPGRRPTGRRVQEQTK